MIGQRRGGTAGGRLESVSYKEVTFRALSLPNRMVTN